MIRPSTIVPVLGSFAAGTEVQTARGPVRVERLTPGDWIEVNDGDGAILQGVRCHTRLSSKQGLMDKPVLIRAGALGGGLPRRDLIVASGQRLVMIDSGAPRPEEDCEVLVPAAGLTVLPGVRRMKGRRKISLFSLIFNERCSVKAEGCGVFCGQGWISRWADALTAGRAGALSSLTSRKSGPRILSIAEASQIAPRLQADLDLPKEFLTHRRRDLLEWDRDLEDEKRAAKERAADLTEAEQSNAAAERRGAA